LKLFYPEHRRALETFYEAEADSYAGLLESPAGSFEKELGAAEVLRTLIAGEELGASG
jgi:hypothetical protein